MQPVVYEALPSRVVLGSGTLARLGERGRGPEILPETVIHDVDPTLTLPPALSANSGINAIAHAVEALYAVDRNPIVSLMAEDGIAELARALPAIVAYASDRSARSDALYGAWLRGACLGLVGMALHHKLCHTLGGTFDLPHADIHGGVLPHAVAYNAASAPEAMARVVRARRGRARRDRSPRPRRPPRRRPRPERPRRGGFDRAADPASPNSHPNQRAIERGAPAGVIARARAGGRPVA